MSPYIVTQSAPPPIIGGLRVIYTRRAVATLDEARQIARDALLRLDHPDGRRVNVLIPLSRAVEALTIDLGGNVGPFPDGTSIEVSKVSWAEVRGLAGLSPQKPFTEAEILNAFNTQETQA